MSASPLVLGVTDQAAAIEELHALGCTDGLPVVLPTEELVQRGVLATGLDPDLVLGELGPSYGVATVEKVVANAVMAGCVPDHLPVVVAAVRAIADPAFDLPEMQGTTHDLAPLVIVHGLAAASAGVSGGWGCFGPGHRANVSIGRALRLVMMNIGGARPGVSDMSLMGHPGKLSFCIAETHDSPWPELVDEAAVTVVGVSAPKSVVHVGDADRPDSPDRLLRSLAVAVSDPAANNAHFKRGSVVCVLNPEHAHALATAGFSRRDVTEAIFERSGNERGALRSLNPSFTGPGDEHEVLRPLRSIDDLIVLVAGGPGLYSAVMTGWGAGAHGNVAVRRPVELDQACAVPGLG